MFECLPPLLSPSIVDLMAYLKNYGFVGTPTEESQEESQEKTQVTDHPTMLHTRPLFLMELTVSTPDQKVVFVPTTHAVRTTLLQMMDDIVVRLATAVWLSSPLPCRQYFRQYFEKICSNHLRC